MSRRRPRAWCLAFDAMDPGLLREAAASGRCPHFADLLARGSVATVRSPPALYVGSIWPSFSTATGAARHGRACFVQHVEGTYRFEPYGARQLVGEPFWRRAEAAGARTVVIDVPKSRFYGDGRGVEVVDWGTHDPEADGFRTAPAALERRILSEVGPAPFRSCDEVRRSAADYAHLRDHLVERARRREAILAMAVEAVDADLVAIAFTEPHCAGHQLWHLHDPRHVRHDPAVRAALGDPVLDLYAALDATLGRVLAHVPDDARLIVLASHGMGPHYDGTHCLDEALERLEPSLPGGKPPSVRGRLARWIDRPTTRRWSHRLRRKVGFGLPLPARAAGRTCFLVPNNEAWAGIRVNLVGREPQGRIRPGAEYDAYLSALEAALREVRNGETQGPAFGAILRTRDLYPLPHAAALPDLVAEWRRDAPFPSLTSPRIGRVEGKVRGTRTGDHRSDGLAVAVGPGLASGAIEPVRIEDLAPTMLSWLGIDWPGVDGRPVRGWA